MLVKALRATVMVFFAQANFLLETAERYKAPCASNFQPIEECKIDQFNQ